MRQWNVREEDEAVWNKLKRKIKDELEYKRAKKIQSTVNLY
jgi:hypothetical protein